MDFFLDLISKLTYCLLMFMPFSNVIASDPLQGKVYCQLFDEISHQFIAEIRRDLQFTPSLTGGALPYDIEKFSIHFDSAQSADLNQARRMAVRAIERLKKRVDACTAVHPYLREYPCPNATAGIVIHFSNIPFLPPEQGIQTVSNVWGTLYFDRYADNGPAAPSFLKEPYETSLAIVKAQYPEDFPAEEAPSMLVESFKDPAELIPFDIRMDARNEEFKRSFSAPFQELDELVLLGLTATHSQNLSLVLRDLTRNITHPYFDDAFFERVDTFQKKQINGEYREYWSNGQLKFRAQFKDGVPDQHFHGWYSTGEEAFKGFFENGRPMGVHMAFLPNFVRGKSYDANREVTPHKFSNTSARVLAYNKKGQLHGTQLVNYPSDRLLAQFEFVNGVLHGSTTVWGSNKCLAERTYKNGQLVFEGPLPKNRR